MTIEVSILKKLKIKLSRLSCKTNAAANIFIDEILQNSGTYRYNALQAEVRRRFNNGLSFQVNYTFQKTLSNIPDEGQNRQGELQDNGNPGLNVGRPDYDRTHTVNANMIYELPFGKGKAFLDRGGLIDKIFGGFQFTSIVNLSSGPPLGVNAAYVQTGFLARSNLGRNTFRTRGFNETDLVILKNTRFGPDDRFNLQIGAEIIDLFNQRPRTIGGTGAQVEALFTGGVGSQTAAFAIPGNANFLDYSGGLFTGRTITMRAKFIF